MLKTGLFEKAHLTTLKKAVDAYAQRHQVTAQNIANVESPGYRAQKLKFEEMLTGAGASIQGYRTHPNHIPIGSQGIGSVQPESEYTHSAYDNGVNNVDIDAEMADLATNDLSYRLATRLLSQRYSVLRGAIKGSMR